MNNTSMKKHKTSVNITEKLNCTSTAEYKTDMNVTEKLNSTFTTEHKTDMNITKLDKYKKTEHDGIQNRHEHY